MRLFVFAIGGTGSRVLKSMVLQFASGVIPVDPTGKPVKNLTIVPIIIDPHQSNAAVQSVNKLLDSYRKVRKELYGDKDVEKGFFAVKVETLRNVASSADSQYKFNDGFIYEMPQVANSRFEEFINIASMEPEDKLFAKMIFSGDELETQMNEGFYGSPNIGTVALNVFQESDNFTALKNCFRSDDRIFFIGSIFGGTGAAGMPMFISSLRQVKENINLAHAAMAALVVMPYFTIEQDENSKISQADFIIKTQTALRYYVDNLNPYVNSVYYAADTCSPQAFRNDAGKDGQKTNKSHIVEFISALAIDDFAGRIIPDHDVWMENQGRIEAGAASREAKQFSLEKGPSLNPHFISFLELDGTTRSLVMLPMMKFHLLTRFIYSHLGTSETLPFAKNHAITESSISPEFRTILAEYDSWIKEMSRHGDHAHNLWLFSDIELPKANKFTDLYNNINPQKGTFSRKELNLSDITDQLNKQNDALREQFTETDTPQGKLLKMADNALETAIKDNLNIKDLI